LDRELFIRFVGRYRSRLLVVLAASALFNVLVFSGSLYLMLVYDSVLPSRSLPTLFGLFAILTVLYVFQYIFDVVRSDALLTIANGVHDDLAPAVNYAVMTRSLKQAPGEGDGQQPLRDLDQVHSFLSSSGPTAVFDLPWLIVFILILFMLHWTLGLTALIGVLVLVGLTVWTSRKTHAQTHDMARLGNVRAASRNTQVRFTEAAVAMGMEERLRTRTAYWDREYLAGQTGLSGIISRLGGAGRTFRLMLQSVLLTVGALLVIDDKATGGIIIASSVLAGRALAPVDQAIANWRGYAAARSGWTRIAEAITAYQLPSARSVILPRPKGRIALRDIWVVPPGSSTPAVSGISLTLEPGQALAIIGPSAAGKTSLIKALLGIWPTARGEIRIDGATHDQWDREALGASFGYVPQIVELMEGSISENIARFDPESTSELVMAAAREAGMHDMILTFPNGYDTHLSAGGVELSAGFRQRIGLARALYGKPHLLVLDEANSNLDAAGDAALAEAIISVRERQGIVVMVTHRPATLGPVTHIAVLANGRLADFGERNAVLERTMKQSSIGGEGDAAAGAEAAKATRQ
jgi:ATP-binding cassette subfamily C protein PrsD